MKRLLLKLLIILVMLSGCSSKVTKIYIEPKKASFVVADVNVSSVPVFKPRDIDVSKDRTKITTSVNTFSKISNITKKLRLKVKIYKEAFEGLKRQILNYNKRLKDED